MRGSGRAESGFRRDSDLLRLRPARRRRGDAGGLARRRRALAAAVHAAIPLDGARRASQDPEREDRPAETEGAVRARDGGGAVTTAKATVAAPAWFGRLVVGQRIALARRVRPRRFPLGRGPGLGCGRPGGSARPGLGTRPPPP